MSVVALAEVKAHLNITVATHDGELQALIDSAEAAIGERVGPLSSTAQTSRVRGGSVSLVLPVIPAVSLTSVTPSDDGTALTLADLYLDGEAGVVTYDSGGSSFSARYYDVVYQAGRSTCPADLKLAVKELVRHLWTTQRGPTARAGIASEMAANSLPGAAYAFPFRVEQLIAPHEQPGFA